MFRYEIEVPPFGRLSKQGRHTKNWSGSIALPPFDGAFDLVLHAAADGPLPAQTAAMQQLVATMAAIREAASAPMGDLYRESGIEPPIDDRALIWSRLEPAFVEICDESYYGDARICIMVAFSSRAEPEFLPAIETADGRFAGVLSGT